MYTKKISVCSWCGNVFEIEENEIETDTCGECDFYDEDMIGEIDDDDLVFLKGEK